MKGVLVVLCLTPAACGRVGFDEQVKSDAVGTGNGDAIGDSFVNQPAGVPTVVSVGMQTSSGSSNNFVTIAAPTGIVAGDLLVAAIGPENNNTMTSPGWTLLVGGNIQVMLYKLATSAEPASYTFTGAGNMRFSSGILRLTGVNQGTPIDSGAGAPSSSNTRTTPSLTTSVAKEALLACWGNALGGNMSPPAGMPQVLDNYANLTASMCGLGSMVTAGATGSFTSTGGGVGPYAADLIAILPP